MHVGILRAVGLLLLLLSAAQPAVAVGWCPDASMTPAGAGGHDHHGGSAPNGPSHSHTLPCESSPAPNCTTMPGCGQVGAGLPETAATALLAPVTGSALAERPESTTRSIAPDIPPPRI